ncbi:MULTISPECIES: hypothetical protein [unclassified Aliivibrio]|jgi:hypothetical protein|uniref:hypothetical protein n=1 Tax=unclassified Aliivibrio TaxID=2645654 RepID=UPI00080DE223|nr:MULTISPECIES: hypothetical protein [unclassified Aliivibrio]OCH16765.1 hypothetical protein A6E05_02750 [Aliivibrio sp. 1S165]OCH19185.1 hypothetical protein A6E03_12025 [Aliivibrio sp. 1S128]OCH32783.1 hypothetical protein A6E06_01715 [Aliivibrio sp. 1S175]
MKSNRKSTVKNLIIVFTVLIPVCIAAKPFLSNIEHQSKLRVLEGIETFVTHTQTLNDASSVASDFDTDSVIRLVNPQDSLLTSVDNNSVYIGFSDSPKTLKNTKCYFHYTQANESTLTASYVIENSGC